MFVVDKSNNQTREWSKNFCSRQINAVPCMICDKMWIVLNFVNRFEMLVELNGTADFFLVDTVQFYIRWNFCRHARVFGIKGPSRPNRGLFRDGKAGGRHLPWDAAMWKKCLSSDGKVGVVWEENDRTNGVARANGVWFNAGLARRLLLDLPWDLHGGWVEGIPGETGRFSMWSGCADSDDEGLEKKARMGSLSWMGDICRRGGLGMRTDFPRNWSNFSHEKNSFF